MVELECKTIRRIKELEEDSNAFSFCADFASPEQMVTLRDVLQAGESILLLCLISGHQGHYPVSPHLPVKANVVIDQTCRARLADFGLLMVVSDSINLFSSGTYTLGGTLRWMSPELIARKSSGPRFLMLLRAQNGRV